MSVKNIALITGGTGYLGRNLTRKLLDSGWEVHLLVRDLELTNHYARYLDGSETHLYDDNLYNLIKILEAAKPTVVFHLAAKVVSDHKLEYLDDIYKSNILLGSKILEAMRFCKLKKFVNTGTFWQYFNNDQYDPVSLYAATKQAFEAILKYYAYAEKFEVITLTLFDNYGPDDTRPKLFSILNKAALNDEPLKMSAGEQLIDIVYIDDVVEAYINASELLCLESKSGYQNYVVSSAERIRLRELVELYLELAPKQPKILWGARPYRKREIMNPWSSGVALPGWKPRIGLREGIAKIVAPLRGGDKS